MDTITLNIKELTNLLDQAINCKEEGIKAQYKDTSITSIDNWVREKIF